jgi:hypothetical protein
MNTITGRPEASSGAQIIERQIIVAALRNRRPISGPTSIAREGLELLVRAWPRAGRVADAFASLPPAAVRGKRLAPHRRRGIGHTARKRQIPVRTIALTQPASVSRT